MFKTDKPKTLSGPQMMLKNMLGIDPQEIIEQFQTQITQIGTGVAIFDARLQRVEKMLAFLCQQQGISDVSQLPDLQPVTVPQTLENGS